MKKLFILGVAVLFARELLCKDFQIINNTEFPLQILWKSNGLGPETRSGKFVLQPDKVCAACIETYDENCVHILYIQTLNGKYKARSKPFCQDSEIIISLKTGEDWKGSSIKKLDIEIKDATIKAKL